MGGLAPPLDPTSAPAPEPGWAFATVLALAAEAYFSASARSGWSLGASAMNRLKSGAALVGSFKKSA
jgi:hypothetical protein